MSGQGIVYLVGAGPGDPGLITVKGLEVLKSADVVAYDRLVHPDILRHASDWAKLIYVGKAPGRHAFIQDEINALLIAEARAGHVVVRLKGGDPFVYGRGGEEAQELRDADVRYEIVPGVTSAIAAPAYAGIPLTFRHVARSFAVVAGHAGEPEDEPDWASLVRIDTLVFLMGLGNIRHIVASLLANGLGADRPAAIIRAATTRSQVVVRGTLRDIGDLAEGLRPPAVLVVGDVVRLAEEIDWYQVSGEAQDRWPSRQLEHAEATL